MIPSPAPPMTPSFATSLDALGDWRATLSTGVEEPARFLAEHDLRAATAAQLAALRQRLGRQAGRRLRRRVLARQVRADQRDLLRRYRPPHPAGHAGPHHDVPGRARLATPASRPRCCCCRSRRAARAPRSPSCATSRAPGRAAARRRRRRPLAEALQEVTRTDWVSQTRRARSASGTTRRPTTTRRSTTTATSRCRPGATR